MTTQKILLSGLISLSVLSFGACTSANMEASEKADETIVAKADQKQSGYLKPGASIEFSHNYDGKTAPGEVESFQVFVKGGSLVGNVDVKMQNDDGLKIYSDASAQKLSIAPDTIDGLDHTMNVSVGAQEPGRYYLNFMATTGESENKMMRAYAIAIQVGDQPYVPELGKGMTVEETPEGEKIITMEATETIEN